MADDDQTPDLVIEYTIDGGQTWRHGKTVPAWVGNDPGQLRVQRAAVRDQARADHGNVERVTTRVLAEDDPRTVINQPVAADPAEVAGQGLERFLAGMTGSSLVYTGSLADLMAAADLARLGSDADDAAGGIFPVAVVHGDPEPDANARAMFEELPRLSDAAGHVVYRGGGNDYTVYKFGGPGAEQAAARFAADAIALARRERLTWWRVTLTAWPEFS